jgi:pentatricopeptide repeat protein
MSKRLNIILSICIFGKNCVSILHDCIKHATKLTDEIFFVDVGSDDQSKSKAAKLGARVVELHSLPSALQTEWVLFIKPDERQVLSSAKKFQKMIRNKQMPGYGVYTNSTNTRYLLEDYQWVPKLEQFKNVDDSAYVHTIEPRLVRKSYAKICIECLATGDTEKISWVCRKIAAGISIESIRDKESDSEESYRDHDIRCLKGEFVYDISPADNMMELSEMYTGFRLVHKNLLDSFIEGAKRGFGNLKMYISMLDFLCKEGLFNEAKKLFEVWIEHRPDDKEIYHTQATGGIIYSNLLDIDKAIAWLEKIVEKTERLSVMENLGKLYLVKGEKEKAVEWLEKLKDVRGNTFSKEILSVIDRDEWQPLRLSLCMIARNEKAQIGKAMKSVEGITDEIIVVDTGSSDGTTEIVKKFGGRVIEAKWENDFSKAKNIAIDEATGDYILFIDADEFIDSRHRFALALFKKLLPMEKNIAFEIKIEPPKASKELGLSYLDRLLPQEEGNYQVRLFPGNSAIRFRGKIFEDPEETLKNMGVNVRRNDMFTITNSMEGREWRDERKMPAALNAFESIHDPQKNLKGGLLFLRVGDLDRAYPWLIKACEFDPGLSAKIGAFYSRQNRLEMAKGIIIGALERFPESPELLLSAAEIFYKEENYNEFINILANRIETIEKNLESEDSTRAMYYYGIALLETDNIVPGVEQLTLAREKEPANVCYKIAVIYAFSKVDHWEEALQVAAQIANEEGIAIPGEVNDFVDAGKIFMAMNHHFVKAGKTEEANLCRRIVEDVIKTKVSGGEDIQRMSAVIEAAGSHG